jgi:hypothetical protein
MRFLYRSARTGESKELPADMVAALREHLVYAGFDRSWTMADLQACLLSFVWEERTLLINQLEPIFTYCGATGTLWDEESGRCWDFSPWERP